MRKFSASRVRIVLADGTDFDLSDADEVILRDSCLEVVYPAQDVPLSIGGTYKMPRWAFLSSSEWRRLLSTKPGE